MTEIRKNRCSKFGRCLVHFAVDPDEAYMCAQLTGNDSNFLPFNKGYNYGKGYPVNPNGHKSAYLPLYSMKQVIEEKFILDVLANYTTYKSYYEVQKSVEENPLFNTVKHRKSLRLLSRPARKLLR